MIFVTIGTQLAFPRLIKAMAALAPQLGEEVIAQIGPDNGSYAGITCHETLSPAEYSALFSRARVVVAHAGIGTVLSAKSQGKPLVVMPRRHALGEHRNDHQLATARQLEGLTGIHVAWDAADLAGYLNAATLTPATSDQGPRSATLIDRIRTEIAR